MNWKRSHHFQVLLKNQLNAPKAQKIKLNTSCSVLDISPIKSQRFDKEGFTSIMLKRKTQNAQEAVGLHIECVRN